MNQKPYHIPAWEIPLLREIVDGRYPAARIAALERYTTERERRRRHAAVRDSRDPERRTLVGAHVPRRIADQVAVMAELEGTSVTAWVREAIQRKAREADP